MIEKTNLEKARQQIDLAFSVDGHQTVPGTDMLSNDVISELIRYWGIDTLTPEEKKETKETKKAPRIQSYRLSSNEVTFNTEIEGRDDVYSCTTKFITK